ncbi:helix-turn-helix domain-containing protein [Lonsdalea quercina]|uniref:helix-turn-helix domain-containing protein n=1 Tax=Lonsdalea quercina TaxID=71657 RepID=UPI0039760BE8
MSPIRTLQQRYWFSPQFPFLECRSTWQSQQPYKVHSHAQLSVGCLERGSTQCRVGEQTYLLNAGDVVVIPPDLPHSCNPLPGQSRSYHMLYLDASWCHREHVRNTGLRKLPDGDIVTYRSSSLSQLVMQIIHCLHASELEHVERDLLRLFAALFQPPSVWEMNVDAPSRSNVARHVQQRLLENLQDAPSLTVLAHELAMRPETLVRHFRQETGMTPMAYLNNARVEHAKRLIRQGETLADTGYTCGFSDQSHFHRTFVNFTAATPGQYRQARSIFHNK